MDRHGTQARDVVRLGRELDLLRPLAEDVPHLEAEVAWAVRDELALGLDDVLSRADAPLDGPARPLRVPGAARGRHHGRGAGLGRAPPGRSRSRPTSPRRAASTTCLVRPPRLDSRSMSARDAGRKVADAGSGAGHVLALDQGTTSSRAIVFDRAGTTGRRGAAGVPAGLPLPRPRDPRPRGHLAEPARGGARGRGRGARRGGRHRRPRHHQPARDDRSSGSARRAAPWRRPSSGRAASPRSAARGFARPGHEPRIRALTGLPLDAYFSGPKIAHILDSEPGLRRPCRGRRALLRDGRQLPRLAPDRRPAARHRRLQRQPDAALRHLGAALGPVALRDHRRAHGHAARGAAVLGPPRRDRGRPARARRCPSRASPATSRPPPSGRPA